MSFDSNVKKSDSRPAIAIRNVHKEFIIPHERKTTLFENLLGAFSSSTYEKFVSLKNINLVIEKGESVGIIGDNGSGKSTLLKILAKILRPTSGSVEVNGRITPFLELGVGFQPDLTARENIEVYSTIMGLSRKEIAANMDSVLEFAGLMNFKDTKLKNFSSGMQVRLAFATAIQMKPEILLVDEVLAVGDMEFQQKCLDIFQKYKEDGITLIFVSHDLTAVRRFCDKVLLLKGGQQVAYGNTGEIIDRYIYGVDKPEAQSSSAESPAPEANETANPEPVKRDRWGNQKIVITDVTLYDKYGNKNDRINAGDPLSIQIRYVANEPVHDPVLGIAIYSDSGLLCYGTNTYIKKIELGSVTGEGCINISIPRVEYVSGKFLLTVAAHTKDHVPLDWLDKKYSFHVIGTSQTAGLFEMNSEWSAE